MPHGHKHGHHHHHVDPDAGDMRVALAVGVNLLLTVAQVVGGVLAGSLALIADALHNFSDAISLVIAFGARRIARRPSDEAMTFGYGRVEVVAALINYTTLIVIGLYLLYEAAMRFADPQPVEGWLIVIIAGIALIVDAVTAALTYAMSKSSVNIRAAFLHNVADALGYTGSVGVQLYRDLAQSDSTRLEFFRVFTYAMSAGAVLLLAASLVYFMRKTARPATD